MDREIIEQKLESLRRCLHRVQTRCPADATTLETDLDLQYFTSFARAVLTTLEKQP